MIWLAWACTSTPDESAVPDDSVVAVHSGPADSDPQPDTVERVPAAHVLELSHAHGMYDDAFTLTARSKPVRAWPR